MQTCRCLFGPRSTPIVHTKAIALTTAFPLKVRNRNTLFGPMKSLMTQSQASKRAFDTLFNKRDYEGRRFCKVEHCRDDCGAGLIAACSMVALS
jgi:hypothetical protein